MDAQLSQIRVPHKAPPRSRPAPPEPPPERAFGAARELERALRKRLQGEVHFHDGARALYSTDASNYRQLPIGVVLPAHEDDLIQAVAVCRAFAAPIVMRGGGTSLAGQSCNVAVLIDTTKYMHHLLELDPERRLARVQPGLVLDHLRNAAERHHLTFAPDPATHNHCTLGGMIGNNSCGVHSVMGGRTADNIAELEVLTYRGLRLRVGPTSEEELAAIIHAGGPRGEIYAGLKSMRDRYAPLIRARYPKIPRRVSGYNLDELLPENGFHVARALVGTEGTCVVVLSALAQLIHSPPHRTLLVLGYPDVYSAGDHIPEIMAFGPTALEGLDDGLVADMKQKGMHPGYAGLLPEGGGWLLVEFGGETKQEADAKAHGTLDALRGKDNAPHMKIYQDPTEAEHVWKIRESGLGATANVPGKKLTWPGWEDAAVPPDKVGDYLRDFRALLQRYGLEADLYGHLGQGCIHCRISFDMETAAGIKTYRAFVESAASLVIRYGGSLSGEHGDGQSRAELLPKMYGSELIEAFREFKRIWDPDWQMNPGKVVDPNPLDADLRLGKNYEPWEPETHFQYPDDHHSFARATLRCVGVGKCRRLDGGTMCPSYMVTREEKHSTRGRARLLFEMLQKEELKDGWSDPHVREALDLCLSCKGCKGDCPINVDMATYKAEFLSHYYKGRLRPPSAYSMGLIYWWSRLAAHVPRLANFFTQTPGLSRLMKAVGGIAPRRRMPPFAEQTFRQWFHQRPPVNTAADPILLWPDTFNNHFHPQVAIAAVEVLEAAGYRVMVPDKPLCCGRPLYDFGMLDLAKRLLQQTLDVLRPLIEDGVPVVGLEPSCVAVFRDEMPNLFPNDKDAERLRDNCFLLSEFLCKKAPGFSFPKLERAAVLHEHCHHKAVLDKQSEKQVLTKMGVRFEAPDTGCCGMAGSFGFEKEHYEISQQIGERVLLPKVREAPKNSLIIADGFSCRTQIAESSDRRGLHLAQVLQMGLREGPVGPGADYPERAYDQPPRAPRAPSSAALLGGVVVLSAAAAWALARRD
jgi:FAD/FMN-containing dehydrogenase/Fe-S oxidoreductase